MAEKTQYQKRKEVSDLLNTLDRGQKSMLLEALLGEWAETLPKKGKEYGVSGGNGKYTERLEWLQEHWGTAFESKGSTALRKMPLSGVLELLALFCLGAADSDDMEVSCGSLEDGSELGDKVASALSAMKQAAGPQVVISQAAYNQLQQIRREYEELGGKGPEESTKVLAKILDQLQAMPSVKNVKEVARYESKKKKVDAKGKAFSS
jgi:hypothetical protein